MLLYRDTVKQGLHQIGLPQLEECVSRKEPENEENYVARLLGMVEKRFVGYSIFHVAGRFRLSRLKDRSDAAEGVKNNEPYIFDETTAVVRFIIPCSEPSDDTANRTTHCDPCQMILALGEPSNVEDERKEIGNLFRLLLMEAILSRVNDQDEIWLLEQGYSLRLWRWRKAPPSD